MNTNTLAKEYGKLAPGERLPLLMAAIKRRDTAERDRLVRSTPTVNWQLADYHWFADAIVNLTYEHLTATLDLAAQFWEQDAIVGRLESGPRTADSERRRGYHLQSLALVAYGFCTRTDAWGRIMDELTLQPAGMLLEHLPGYQMLRRTEEVAGIMAFTRETASEYVHETHGEGYDVLTVDDVVTEYRKQLEEREQFGKGQR